MTLAEWFLVIPALCYSASAAAYVAQGRPGLALTFFAYALANVGLIWAAGGGPRVGP